MSTPASPIQAVPRVMLRDMPRALQVDESTIYRWRRSKRLPPPDVAISTRSTWWYVSTLEAAGIRVEVKQLQESPDA